MTYRAIEQKRAVAQIKLFFTYCENLVVLLLHQIRCEKSCPAQNSFWNIVHL